MIFDNSKVKALVPEFGYNPTPLKFGAREVVAWFDSHPEHRVEAPRSNEIMDRLAGAYAPRPL